MMIHLACLQLRYTMFFLLEEVYGGSHTPSRENTAMAVCPQPKDSPSLDSKFSDLTN